MVEIVSIVITTIVVFVLVDLLLRMLLNRSREAKLRKEREQALDKGLKLDVSEEAPTLKRVELENPRARILAVDDEAVILDSFRKMLVMGGYSHSRLREAMLGGPTRDMLEAAEVPLFMAH